LARSSYSADPYPVCSIVARRQARRSHQADRPFGRLCRQNQERPEKAPELEIVALSYHS